jgi:ABC-type phosphate transport system substrate-binding protein
MLLNDNAATSASGTLHPIVPYDWKRTVLDSLSTVTCLGRQVSSTAYLVGMGSSNPLPTLGRYYPASRFVLKYFIGNTDLSVKSLAEGTIDFGQTSAPISAERMQQAPDIMTVPAFCWGIVPAYNLPELVGQPFAGLRMNWSLISDIVRQHTPHI